jgi:hypothetical protein
MKHIRKYIRKNGEVFWGEPSSSSSWGSQSFLVEYSRSEAPAIIEADGTSRWYVPSRRRDEFYYCPRRLEFNRPASVFPRSPWP